MRVLEWFSRYRVTLKGVRAGQEPWRLSDPEIESEGLLSASAFNRVQNLISSLVALPMLLLLGDAYPELELHMATEEFGCKVRELDYMAEAGYAASLLQIALVIFTPSVMSSVVPRLCKPAGWRQEDVRAMYLYLNAALTTKSKTILMVLLAGFWTALAFGLLIENMVTNGGGFPPTADESTYLEYLHWTIGPAVGVSIAMLLPLGFYARFLYRFALRVSTPRELGRCDRGPAALKAAWRPLLLTLILGAAMYLLALFVPFAFKMVAYMIDCGTFTGWL
ncbi:hypothetical protein [Kinneretia aquatilis]|uniref:hypothetical protein n=1 Tax=Kinneretia aquatilis TaxID=2070761 RepID=UPI00149534C4|nr:hypothetical protein [Paucibacter aquatile]WIV98455.1 hypothetical protein K9V56_002785 [Paucibacter aquatile]